MTNEIMTKATVEMEHPIMIDIPLESTKLNICVPVRFGERRKYMPILVFCAPKDNDGDFIPFVKLPNGKVFEAEWDYETCRYAHECRFEAWGKNFILSSMTEYGLDGDDESEWASLTLDIEK